MAPAFMRIISPLISSSTTLRAAIAICVRAGWFVFGLCCSCFVPHWVKSQEARVVPHEPCSSCGIRVVPVVLCQAEVAACHLRAAIYPGMALGVSWRPSKPRLRRAVVLLPFCSRVDAGVLPACGPMEIG